MDNLILLPKYCHVTTWKTLQDRSVRNESSLDSSRFNAISNGSAPTNRYKQFLKLRDGSSRGSAWPAWAIKMRGYAILNFWLHPTSFFASFFVTEITNLWPMPTLLDKMLGSIYFQPLHLGHFPLHHKIKFPDTWLKSEGSLMSWATYAFYICIKST